MKILVDSGFFFALFDWRDSHHAAAIEKQKWLERFPVVIPWPILYEAINTRFVRRPTRIERFETILRRPDTELIDDSRYRCDAYEETFERAKRGYGAKSLVDSVLCVVLADTNVRISAMLTFNEVTLRVSVHLGALNSSEIELYGCAHRSGAPRRTGPRPARAGWAAEWRDRPRSRKGRCHGAAAWRRMPRSLRSNAPCPRYNGNPDRGNPDRQPRRGDSR